MDVGKNPILESSDWAGVTIEPDITARKAENKRPTSLPLVDGERDRELAKQEAYIRSPKHELGWQRGRNTSPIMPRVLEGKQ